MHEAERSLFDLQRGRPVLVSTSSGRSREDGVLLAAVEGLTSETLDRLRSLNGDAIRLAVTNHRARVMGLVSSGQGQDGMSLCLNREASPAEMFRLSSSAGNYAAVAVGLSEASTSQIGGLTLARLARLLPAIIGVRVDASNIESLRADLESAAILTVTTKEITAMARNTSVEVTHVSDGPVPLAEAENARFMSFREANGILEHVAVLIGDRESWPDPVPVRIHSACLTGDLFGSLRCDCGDQLRGSLRVFAASGGGVLLYLAQEGRGIGFGNKLRAYTLQQEGLDTVDADYTLGFGADERRYDAAVEMLRHLRIDRVQLLTNNPEKVRAVQEGGLQVIDRQPLYGTLNRHNLRYVKAKVQRAGHWLGEMLAGAVPTK
jgi:GTP cyclohydrolase II